MINRITKLLALFCVSLFLLPGCGRAAVEPEKLVWVLPKTSMTFNQEDFNALLREKGFPSEVEFVELDNIVYTPEQDYRNYYNDLLSEYLQSGAQADLIYCGYVNDAYLMRVQDKTLAPLNDFLETAEGIKLQQAIPELFWRSSKVDGKNYGLTNMRPNYAYGYSMIANQKYLDKYNIDLSELPESIAEWGPLLGRVYDAEKAEGNEDFYIMRDPISAGYYPHYSPIIPLLVVADERNSELTAVSLFDQPDVIALHKAVASYTQAGYIGDFHDENGQVLQADFLFDVDVSRGWENLAASYNSIFATKGLDPYDLAGRNLTEPVTATVDAGFHGVTEKSVQKERALELLALVFSDPDIANFMCYGKEGVDYTIKDGLVVLNPPFSDSGESYHSPPLGNDLLAAPSVYDDPDRVSLIQSLYEQAAPSKIEGFFLDYSAIQAELEAVWKIYAQEGYISGPAEEIAPQYAGLSQKLKAAGLENILTQINRQLDDWRRKDASGAP